MIWTARVDRAGAALPLVAVMLLGILAVLSLAIDLGMAYTARTEAQRVADASALAGASAYLDWVDPYMAGPDAEIRAKEYAAINDVRNQAVDTANDLSVEFLPAQSTVRVSVWRRGLPTWFARLLGIDAITVSAVAAAAAVNAGSAKCVRPWAIMDMWKEQGGEACGQDANCDGWWDEGEEWAFDPTQDHYEQAQSIGDQNATGYGSAARDGLDGITNDRGRQITVKAQDPNSEFVVNPGTFLPWQMPDGDGGYMNGASDYRTNIEVCNENPVFLSDDATDPDGMYEYPLEFGNMVGPTFQGVRELIQQDPGAYWDPSGEGSIQGSTHENGLDSPRVIIVGLVDPEQLIGSGSDRPTHVRFNNFAMLFLEEQAGTQAPVVARFLYYVNGAGETGPTTGPLVKTLRLIE